MLIKEGKRGHVSAGEKKVLICLKGNEVKQSGPRGVGDSEVGRKKRRLGANLT